MTADPVFLAVANPVRRQLLEMLADGPVNAGDLARAFELSRPAVAEHLQILRRAGLVRDEPSGRHRHYTLQAQPLQEIEQWLHPFERFWRGRLGELARVVEADQTDRAGRDSAVQHSVGQDAGHSGVDG